MNGTFRVGRKVGRTVYLNDVLVGMMDTPELAKMVVNALNKEGSQTPEKKDNKPIVMLY